MSDKARHECEIDDDGDIFVSGKLLDLEALDSAIDALASDELPQAAETGRNKDSPAP